LDTFLSGFGLSLSLILAIGAQNAFVLKQGIKKEHTFVISFICALSDALLILCGVSGFGYVLERFPIAQKLALFGGFVFLMVYGLKSLYSAYKMSHSMELPQNSTLSLKKAILLTLAFTWLNPHVYLDTMVLIGSVSTKFGDDADIFALGAMSASFVFFFSLGYGARVLAPIFAKPIAWKILEFAIGTVMIALACMLMY
jgi:L-lysine exporter family protein LysE/ArgO